MSKIKDRLNEIHQAHDSATVENENDKSDKNKEKKDTKEMKKTLEKAENVMHLIYKIEQNTREVQDLVSNRQNVNGNFYETKEALREINQKLKESTSIALKAANKLKEFNAELNKVADKSSTETRIKLVQYNSLNRQLQNALEAKNEIMEKIRDIQKYNLKAEINIVRKKQDPNDDDEEIERLLHSEGPIQVFTDNILVETEEAKQQLAQLEERHKEFLKIEEQLTEIRDLFAQMALLIEQQQEQLNRVEYHANAATDYIEAVDLGKVRRAKRKYLKRKIYLILIFILVLIVIILLIVY